MMFTTVSMSGHARAGLMTQAQPGTNLKPHLAQGPALLTALVRHERLGPGQNWRRAFPTSSPLRPRLSTGDKGWQDILLLGPPSPLARAVTDKCKVHALQHICHHQISHADVVHSQLHPLLSRVSSQQLQMSAARSCSVHCSCCPLAACSGEPSVSCSRQAQPELQLAALRQSTVPAPTCSVLLIFAVTPGPKNDSIFCCLLVHMSRLMSFFVVNSRICSRAGAAQLWLLLVC